MFKRVLLPLDGSAAAETAIPYAKELAAGLASELVLYHVPRREDEDRKRMHEVYLDSLANDVRKDLAGSKITVEIEVEAGDPTESICRLVGENKIDLLVMTAVSASGLRVGKMLGSVADQVCRTVPIPVMLVRPGNIVAIGQKQRLLNHMLIPVDGSELSKLALPVGEELAFQAQTQHHAVSNGQHDSRFRRWHWFHALH